MNYFAKIVADNHLYKMMEDMIKNHNIKNNPNILNDFFQFLDNNEINIFSIDKTLFYFLKNNHSVLLDKFNLEFHNKVFDIFNKFENWSKYFTDILTKDFNNLDLESKSLILIENLIQIGIKNKFFNKYTTNLTTNQSVNTILEKYNLISEQIVDFANIQTNLYKSSYFTFNFKEIENLIISDLDKNPSLFKHSDLIKIINKILINNQNSNIFKSQIIRNTILNSSYNELNNFDNFFNSHNNFNNFVNSLLPNEFDNFFFLHDKWSLISSSFYTSNTHQNLNVLTNNFEKIIKINKDNDSVKFLLNDIFLKLNPKDKLFNHKIEFLTQHFEIFSENTIFNQISLSINSDEELTKICKTFQNISNTDLFDKIQKLNLNQLKNIESSFDLKPNVFLNLFLKNFDIEKTLNILDDKKLFSIHVNYDYKPEIYTKRYQDSLLHAIIINKPESINYFIKNKKLNYFKEIKSNNLYIISNLIKKCKDLHNYELFNEFIDHVTKNLEATNLFFSDKNIKYLNDYKDLINLEKITTAKKFLFISNKLKINQSNIINTNKI